MFKRKVISSQTKIEVLYCIICPISIPSLSVCTLVILQKTKESSITVEIWSQIDLVMKEFPIMISLALNHRYYIIVTTFRKYA